MKVLVLNCGSSSIKYQFIDTEKEIALAKGLVERIGMGSAVLTHTPYGKDKIRIVGEILDHNIAIEYVIAVLLSPNHGVIKDKNEIPDKLMQMKKKDDIIITMGAGDIWKYGEKFVELVRKDNG